MLYWMLSPSQAGQGRNQAPMSPKKILLSIFLCLVVYSQLYSLAAGVHTITTLTPERLEDTDPEDVVTIDPILTSRTDTAHKLVQDLAPMAPLQYQALLSLLVFLWIWTAFATRQTLGCWGLQLPVPPRGAPLWLERRHLLI